MQQQNVQVDEGIRISDIFRLLFSKLKILILTVLIGGVLGGLFAVWTTYDVDYYGTTIEFYVNPYKEPSSPPSSGAEGEEESQYSVYGAYNQTIMDSIVHLLSSDSFIEEILLEGKALPEIGKWGSAELDAKLAEIINLDGKTDDESIQKKKELTSEALELWNSTPKYHSTLARYRSALSFWYLDDSTEGYSSGNLAKSFICVEISVLQDKDFADLVRKQIIHYVPSNVERNMPVPIDYSGTKCSRITRTDNIALTNPGYTTSQAIKYGLIVGFLSLIVACIAVIVIDRSDKRIRDIETLSRTFNIPLLGVVPSIDDLVEDPNQKKKPTKKEVK